MRRLRLRRLVLAVVSAFAVTGGVVLCFVVVERLTSEGENFSLIEERLYMGGHVKHPPRGTSAVLNLCELQDPYQAANHFWLPIRDSEPTPSIETVRQMVEFIDAQRQAGRTTFVHCLNGVSRSGMAVTAYLMRKNEWTRDQALEFVRMKRPGTRPSPPLMQLLSEWENELRLPMAAKQPQ